MKRSLKNFLLALVIPFLSSVSCDSKETVDKDKIATTSTTAFDLSSVKKAIEKSNAGMEAEIAKGDSAAVAAHYSKYAKLLPDGFPAESTTDGIRNSWGGFMSLGLSLKLKVVDVWGNNDLVVEEGTYVVAEKSGKSVDKGKYIVVWKQEDEKWKMFRDIWNSDAKPAMAK
ncbi:MAG: hypothetical protein ABIQ56_06295 [Chitinophagaceae bacterium]